MSRVGIQPIKIPPGVQVEISEGNLVRVTGPQREVLERQLRPEMKIHQEGSYLRVERPSDSRQHRALHGLTRTLLANMITGVTEGFQKVLELNGVGYRAEKQGNNVRLALGFSHPVLIVPDEGIQLAVEGTNRIIVRGTDLEKVGNMAAKIRSVKPVEPYKQKGLKYSDEQPRRKAGKQGKF